MAATAPAAMIASSLVSTTPYLVTPGDTLEGLARRYMSHRADAETVRLANHISNARHLRIGAVLNIPTALLRTEPLALSIDSFSGAVAISQGAATIAARRGLALHEGDHIATGGNAFVTLSFSDGARMSLPSQTRVTVAALHRVILGGDIDRRVQVEHGRSDYDVTPAHGPRDRFEVSTPMTVAAVRGTEFRVGFDDAAGRSILEVLEGHVAEHAAESAAGAEDVALVDTGSAAVRDGPGSRRLLVKLPPAPALVAPGRVQDEDLVAFTIAAPAAGRQYRVQLAFDAGFTDLFAEAMAEAGIARFANVKNATLFVRATTIDEHGVEGAPATYSFDRQKSSLEAGVGEPPKGARHRLFAFKWRGQGEGRMTYRFVLARDSGLRDRMVDEAGLTTGEIALTDLPPGTYYWQVSVTQTVDGKTYARALKVNQLAISDPKAK